MLLFCTKSLIPLHISVIWNFPSEIGNIEISGLLHCEERGEAAGKSHLQKPTERCLLLKVAFMIKLKQM